MRKLIVLGTVGALIVSGAALLACGGGGEKQAGQEPESKPAEEKVATDKVQDAGASGWRNIPIYSGATRHESEMAARISGTVSGMGDKGSSEVQFFKTGDDYEKVVSYYKTHMPRQGWERIMEKDEEEGWGSMWQKKGGEILVNVSVVKDVEGECGIIIARHEGQ